MTEAETGREPIALLPLGATEQHGRHLPVETDWMIAEGLCRRIEQQCPGTLDLDFLPVEKVGYSIEHLDDPRTKSLAFDEAVKHWIGIGECVHRRGIRKLVMLNAHGGNSPLMTIVATELRVRFNMLAVATSWTRFGYPTDLVTDKMRAVDIHGGFIETSVMLALRPDLVDMGKARDFPNAQADFAMEFTHLRAYGPHAFGWKIGDLTPAGTTGNAAAATAEAGERMLDHAVSGILELLGDVRRFDLSRLS